MQTVAYWDMPKRSRTDEEPKPKRTPKARSHKRDENQTAFDIVQRVIEETEGTGKNPLAVALGRLGGLKGGRARAVKMSPEERAASARRAANARWGGEKSDK